MFSIHVRSQIACKVTQLFIACKVSVCIFSQYEINYFHFMTKCIMNDGILYLTYQQSKSCFAIKVLL